MKEKNKDLEKEFKYYLDHQEELVKKYSGRYLVIKNEKVIGDYNNESEAYLESIKNNKPGTFLIQLCLPGSASYSQTYNSRVIFN
jgi:hypothetical protein